jgi:hypothetical protein
MAGSPSVAYRPYGITLCRRGAELRQPCALDRRSNSTPLLVAPTRAPAPFQCHPTHPQDLVPGERLIEVPRALQVRDSGTPDARLAALMESVPRAAGRNAGAWQFKMALQLIAYRLEGPGGRHHPYICTLPGVAEGVGTPAVAMRLGPGELEALQHPQLAADAAGQVGPGACLTRCGRGPWFTPRRRGACSPL